MPRGTTARPHCLADDTAIRCQRSRRRPSVDRRRADLGSLGEQRLNRRDAEHHRIADDVVHLVALEHRDGERDRDGRFGRRPRWTSTRRTVARDFGHAIDHRLPFVAAAIEHAARRRPRSSRSTRARCAASSSGSSMVDPSCRAAGTKNRGITARVYTLRRCFFAARPSGSTASSHRSAAAASVRSISPKTRGSTRRSRSRFRIEQNLDFGELLREPRLLASLSHPNVVTVLTAEKQDDVFFIVMEYVPGDTLEQIIEREGALDLPRVLDYTCQICNAMDHAHRQGVIHRDLRPGNVLVTEQGMVKVADFGTSRFLEIAAHGTTVIGSPPYMAPEQFQGKAVFASDIYSLGVTMYQMLTGSLPYNTPSPGDLERLMRGELTTPPRDRNQKIPKGISDIVMKAMAPDIASRYARAADLLEAVLSARARPGCRRGGAHRRRRSRGGTPAVAAGAARQRHRQRERRRHPGPPEGARSAAGPLLLALPEAAPCPHRSCPFCGEAAVNSTAGLPHRRPLRQFMPRRGASRYFQRVGDAP